MPGIRPSKLNTIGSEGRRSAWAFGGKSRTALDPQWCVADPLAKIANLFAGTHRYKTMGGQIGGSTTAATYARSETI
jgi:hypothetical protein